MTVELRQWRGDSAGVITSGGFDGAGMWGSLFGRSPWWGDGAAAAEQALLRYLVITPSGDQALQPSLPATPCYSQAAYTLGGAVARHVT